MPKLHILKLSKRPARVIATFSMLLMFIFAPMASVSAFIPVTDGGGTGGSTSPATTPSTGSTGGCQTSEEGADGCYSQCNSENPASGCVTCNGNGCEDSAAKPNATCNKSSGCNLVDKYINPLINTLSLIFGLIAVASIIMGGIQFTTSEGDPQKAAKAKSRISKTIIALFAYAFLYAFLQFLVPGGIFHS